jgi:hypothetical protein
MSLLELALIPQCLAAQGDFPLGFVNYGTGQR